MTPNPQDSLLWVLAAVIFGCTALVLTIFLFWERQKRRQAEEERGELSWRVRRYAKDILLEEGREGSKVTDFCDRERPETLLFILSPDGVRERYRLPLHAREENGSFSDRSS